MVHLEAVEHARIVGGQIEEDAAIAQDAVLPTGESADVLPGRVVDVKRGLVGREGETAGQREILRHYLEGAVGARR